MSAWIPKRSLLSPSILLEKRQRPCPEKKRSAKEKAKTVRSFQGFYSPTITWLSRGASGVLGYRRMRDAQHIKKGKKRQRSQELGGGSRGEGGSLQNFKSSWRDAVKIAKRGSRQRVRGVFCGVAFGISAVKALDYGEESKSEKKGNQT